MSKNILKPKIVVVEGRPMTTTLAVAEHFDKQHKHVLHAIEEKVRILADPAFTDQHFIRTTYLVEGQTRPYPMYRLSKIGFAMTAMGFTGAKALAWQRRYVEIFDSMEQAALRQQVAQRANDTRSLDSTVEQLAARVAFLEAAMVSGDKKEVDERVRLFNLLVKTRRNFGALAMTKTRFIADQSRVSSAELHNRLVYALTKAEAAVLWALIQNLGQSQCDREATISVKDLLLSLVPAIRSPATVTRAALRLAARGLVAIRPGHPTRYEVHLDKVMQLLGDFDAKWLGDNTMNARHLVPGVTDIEQRHGDAAYRYDTVVPKRSKTLIRRVDSIDAVVPVIPEQWLALERVFRLLPDPYTGADAVELNDETDPVSPTKH